MTNAAFELAEEFALATRQHCFITGKAGTGKTTLLKRIVEKAQKNVIVVAPTGVAAINAGGVTIHSMFGLPLTAFVPTDDFVNPNLATNRRRMVHDHIHFRRDKLRLLRELDLLIIDEISMVRSDVLDAIDLVLRTVRRNELPFGGVQALLFGDMHQLPPVARDKEWDILKSYYQSPYFFDSLVWPQANAAEIELTTIYRQTDARFLSLLSHIRDHTVDREDYERLRERYQPEFRPTEPGYVLLSTHNQKADSVNASELARLPGRIHSFEAETEGEFPENLFPCERVIQLKVGAQVMFIRNDTEEGRYYNGRLAVVTKIDGPSITVVFHRNQGSQGEGGGDEYVLHRETWENKDYRLDQQTGNVVEEKLGAFKQFPLRLAWAVTIHKSQGLTFDKVIVDAGRSFAPGQVYVALSRCRSLEGIVLHSLIPPGALRRDQRISEFTARRHSLDRLKETLIEGKSAYANWLLLRLFTFTELLEPLQEWLDFINKKEIPEKEAALAIYASVSARAREIIETAGKFERQLQGIIGQMKEGEMKEMGAGPSGRPQTDFLKERCSKAIRYFTDQIVDGIIRPLGKHASDLAYRKKVRPYLQRLRGVEEASWRKVEHLYEGRFLNEKLYQGEALHSRDRSARVAGSAAAIKKEKGGTYRDTLDLHRQGKTAEEIALIRGLAPSTIKQHLAQWITKGEIDVYAALPAELVDAVMAFLKERGPATVGSVRKALGSELSYDDIRMVMCHASREAGRVREDSVS